MGIHYFKGPVDRRTIPQRVSDEVKKYLKDNGISYRKLASQLGTSGQNVGYYLNGKKFMPKDAAKKLAALYPFDEYYLLHGTFEYIGEDKDGGPVCIPHYLLKDQEDLTWGDAPDEVQDAFYSTDIHATELIDALQTKLKLIQDYQIELREQAKQMSALSKSCIEKADKVEKLVFELSNSIIDLKFNYSIDKFDPRPKE